MLDQLDGPDLHRGLPTGDPVRPIPRRSAGPGRAPLLVALAILFVGVFAAEASAQLRGRVPRGGGYGYEGGSRSYNAGGTYASRNRLYRHRSGYLYGQSRPYQYRGRGFFYGGYPGGGGCDVGAYAITDFDSRRDRLLEDAKQIDVSYLGNMQLGGGTRAPAVRPEKESAEWTNLAAGEAVRALGGFTARLFSNPTDIEARIGFGIAAGLIGDDESARESFRMAVRIDPDALCDFEADGEIAARIQEVLALTGPAETAETRFTASALHCLLGEDEAAKTALGREDGDARPDPAARTLREVLAKARAEGQAPATEAAVEESLVTDEAVEEIVARRDGA